MRLITQHENRNYLKVDYKEAKKLFSDGITVFIKREGKIGFNNGLLPYTEDKDDGMEMRELSDALEAWWKAKKNKPPLNPEYFVVLNSDETIMRKPKLNCVYICPAAMGYNVHLYIDRANKTAWFTDVDCNETIESVFSAISYGRMVKYDKAMELYPILKSI